MVKPLACKIYKKMMRLIEYYDKVLAINPTFVDALNNKGVILKDLKRYDESIEYMTKHLQKSHQM